MLMTPLGPRSVAHWVGFVDRPDGRRKVQRDRQSRWAAGLPALLALTSTVDGLFAIFDPALFVTSAHRSTEYLGLIAAVIIVMSESESMDDHFGIRGSLKLILPGRWLPVDSDQ